MKNAVFSYGIEILDEPFIEGDISYAKTVKVVSLSEDGRMYDTHSYGYMDKNELYARINEGKDIQLDRAYVKNFSLKEYRSLHGIKNDRLVVMNNFSAFKSFFDADDQLNFAYASFQGAHTNFNQAIFGGSSLSFYHSSMTAKKVDFSAALFFVHEVNFRFTEFKEAEVIFQGASFLGDELSFINSGFTGPKADFSSVDFHESNVRFQFARFRCKELLFEKSQFRGNLVDFSKSEFKEAKVDFRLCDFGNAAVSFDECEFGEGRIRFRKAKFGSGNASFELCEFLKGELSFERVEFGSGKVSFYQSIGKLLSFKLAHLNGYLDLRLNRCQQIDLSRSIVRDIVDLSPSEKASVQIDEVNFSEMRNLGKLFLDWEKNKVLQLIEHQQGSTLRQKTEQLRMLKEEFGAQGLYSDEDKAYLEFKRYELRYKTAEVLQRNPLNALWVYPFNFLKVLVLDKIGHYATNPARVLVSMLLTYLFFSFLFVFFCAYTSASIESSIGEPEKLSLVAKSFYHSAITFLTIGYGDYYPYGFIRWLSGLEGFVGLFLMSYFTVAFVRKILR